MNQQRPKGAAVTKGNYYELFFEMFTCRTFDSYLHNGRVGSGRVGSGALLKCLTALDPYVKAKRAKPFSVPLNENKMFFTETFIGDDPENH